MMTFKDLADQLSDSPRVNFSEAMELLRSLEQVTRDSLEPPTPADSGFMMERPTRAPIAPVAPVASGSPPAQAVATDHSLREALSKRLQQPALSRPPISRDAALLDALQELQRRSRIRAARLPSSRIIKATE